METEKIIKLRETLEEELPKEMAEYIVWQLSNMPGSEALAEKTADELIGGKIKPGDIMNKIVKKAKECRRHDCAVMSDASVFRIVREALFIDGVVSDAMAAGFVPSGIPSPVSVPTRRPAINVDLDSLFE